MNDEEKKAMFFKKFNVCISDKDLEKAFKNKNLVETLVDKAIETQYKDNELKVLQKIIEKQSKEIEELKEKTKKCEYYEMVADELYKNSISKDKIKAKIEEYKEKCKNCNFRGKICNEFIKNYECTIGECLKEFYSLLEKE